MVTQDLEMVTEDLEQVSFGCADGKHDLGACEYGFKCCKNCSYCEPC